MEAPLRQDGAEMEPKGSPDVAILSCSLRLDSSHCNQHEDYSSSKHSNLYLCSVLVEALQQRAGLADVLT